MFTKEQLGSLGASATEMQVLLFNFYRATTCLYYVALEINISLERGSLVSPALFGRCRWSVLCNLDSSLNISQLLLLCCTPGWEIRHQVFFSLLPRRQCWQCSSLSCHWNLLKLARVWCRTLTISFKIWLERVLWTWDFIFHFFPFFLLVIRLGEDPPS